LGPSQRDRGGANRPGGQVDRFLHDGAPAAALGFVTHRDIAAEWGAQAHPAGVDVGFELAVDVFGGTVLGAQGDALLGIGPVDLMVADWATAVWTPGAWMLA